MFKGHRVLAIVPARSGSKGIVNKNIKKIVKINAQTKELTQTKT